MGIRSFEQLDVWTKSHALVLEIYRQTARFPISEKFGLQSQMRRAAVSVPANVAEGFSRRTPKEKRRFINIAQGSLEELRYYVILSRDLGYIGQQALPAKVMQDIAQMLNGIERSLKA